MSNRAKQSVTPGRDRNAAIEQGMCFEIVLSGGNLTLLAEGMGSYWQMLDEIARIKFDEISEGDNFARRVVTRHLHQLPTMRPNEEEGLIISFIRQFLDQTNGQASVEVAVVYLARSAWDVSLAIHRWIDPDKYEAIEKDEIWGDEENDGLNFKKPPNIHEVSIGCHTSIEISLTRALDGSSSPSKQYHPALSRANRFSGPRTSL